MVRVAVAALVGGVAVFGWGALSHMVLPLGEMGMKNLPDSTVAAIKADLKEPGFYFFPGMDPADKSEAGMKSWSDRYQAGPRGAVVFDPAPGVAAMSPRQLGTEFVSGLLAAFVAAFIFRMARVGAVGGAVLGAFLGIFGWLSIVVSYWNWYRFPTAMAEGELLDQGIGWLLAGFAMGLIVRGRGPRE
jgi:hypothetical protein